MNTWKARPTVYRGIQMRSRLEARFAALMDDSGWGWEYEPRAYASRAGQYLPDFALTDARAFVEVKPTVEMAYLAMARMQIVWESEPEAALLIFVGNPGLVFVGQRGKPWRCQEAIAF